MANDSKILPIATAAVYLVLYDRLVKRQAAGLEPMIASAEPMRTERLRPER